MMANGDQVFAVSHSAPSWWYNGGWVTPLLLSPLSFLYGRVVGLRRRMTKPYVSSLPVICVGNFTMGGAGKTPTALYVAQVLKALGETPAFLTRGYGGSERGPYLVNPGRDTSEKVGDEPLLLARAAPTIVCADRPEGARFIEALRDPAPTVIVMDDGFQNPTLAKTLNILVVDGDAGVGNGWVFPSGPLREPLASQVLRMDLMIAIGGPEKLSITPKPVSVLRSVLEPTVQKSHLKGVSVIAYTGIARPEKFYRTVEGLSADIQIRRDFPDHHPFSQDDCRWLLQQSEEKGLTLVTTEKDLVRLRAGVGVFEELREKSLVIPVTLRLDKEDERILQNTLERSLEPYSINIG